MTGTRPEAGLEEKIEQLTVELEKLRSLLASLPVLPEKLSIENLSVGQIDFNLDSLNIQEVSGALNLGITNGVNLTAKKERFAGKHQNEQELTVKKTGLPPKSTTGSSKTESPKCRIRFN